MFHFILRLFRSPQREKVQRASVCPTVEQLEERIVPAPLTWFAGPILPAARGGAVAAADQGSAFTLLGGGPSDVLAVETADPAWSAITFGQTRPSETTRAFRPVSGSWLPLPSCCSVGTRAERWRMPSSTTPPPGCRRSPVCTRRARCLGYATDQQGNCVRHWRRRRQWHAAGVDGVSDTQSTNKWTVTAPLPQTLYAESAAYDGNGHIFTFGGVGAGGTILSTVYEYTIATNSWSVAWSMPIAVRDSAAVLASNNLIYVVGGHTSTGTTAAALSYNPATNTWNTETALPGPVYTLPRSPATCSAASKSWAATTPAAMPWPACGSVKRSN